MTYAVKCGPRPRERIIDAARNLFRKHGIKGIGVDAIAEAADSNKMTLYRHFGSKDDLVVVCLKQAADEAEDFWRGLVAANPGDPKAQLKDWVQRAGDFVTVENGNCELLDAAAQLIESDHPARHFIEQIRTSHKNRLIELCRDAGVADAELLVDALTLLIEGARCNWRSAGESGAALRFVSVAERVIADFIKHPSSSRPIAADLGVGI